MSILDRLIQQHQEQETTLSELKGDINEVLRENDVSVSNITFRDDMLILTIDTQEVAEKLSGEESLDNLEVTVARDARFHVENEYVPDGGSEGNGRLG